MPVTLSKGYKLPQTGERSFWSALENNINLSNTHKHDGTDGEQIAPKDLAKQITNILSANWIAVSGGTYKQTVSVPSGYLVDTTSMKFYITAGGQAGQQVHPSVRKITSTTFDVYTNDNTSSYTVVYA